MRATRMDKVIAELVARIGDATGLQTLNGATLDDVLNECVTVGVSDSGPGSRSRVSLEDGLGEPRWREDWTVSCVLTLLSGDVDPDGVLARGVALLDAVDEAVSASRDVAGVWEYAGLEGDRSWQVLNRPSGTLLVVVFPVVGVCLL